MDSTEFKKLLFEVACCAVACDYDIDEREIRELRNIDKSTTYFKDIDLSKQLDNFLAVFKGNEAETINVLVEKIRDTSMSPVEELLVMEIVLRLIYADLRIDEKEIDFLKSIRLALSMSDEIMIDRFGEIDILIKEQKSQKPTEEKVTKKHNYDSADLKSLENVYYKNDDKKK
jgi:hypothetical protein